MPPHISYHILFAIDYDVSRGVTLAEALRRRGLLDYYHTIRRRMVAKKLKTRPDPKLSYILRVPASERAKACAEEWNDRRMMYSVGDIARRMGISKQCVSKALQSAARHGMLSRPRGKTPKPVKKLEDA
jgi:hypothetical protein